MAEEEREQGEKQNLPVQTSNGKTVPYDRFQEVIGERNRLKSELEALANQQKSAGEELSRTRQDLAAALANGARLKVAVAKGLPAELAERLQGKDESELEADADRLAALLRPRSPGVPPPTNGGTSGGLDVERMTPAQIREKREELLKQARGG